MNLLKKRRRDACAFGSCVNKSDDGSVNGIKKLNRSGETRCGFGLCVGGNVASDISTIYSDLLWDLRKAGTEQRCASRYSFFADLEGSCSQDLSHRVSHISHVCVRDDRCSA